MSVAVNAPTPVIHPAADPRRWRALAVVLSATFMALFDFFVVNVAAPQIQLDLHATGAGVELVVGGYAFAYASGMVTGGRLGDLFGHRRLFLLGMAAFSIASLLCGIAQNTTELVGARLLQGLAGAAMVPQVLAIITSLFHGADRAKAFAWFGVTGGIGAVAGQVLGGVLLDANVLGLQWRSVFLINVPVGAVAIVMALRVLPAARQDNGSRLDPLGALGISAALGLVLVPLVLGRSEGWPTWTWISMVAALPVLLVTLYWERRHPEPTLDLALFRDSSFTTGLVGNAAFYAFFGSFMLCLTIVLQSGLGMDPRSAGLTFAPLGVVFAVASVLGRPYVVRYGARVITLGAGISALAMAVLAVELVWLGARADAAWMIGPMVFVGLGNGLALPALTGGVLAGVRGHHAGAAAGVLTTAQQFSSAVGVAILGTVFFGVLGVTPGRGRFVDSLSLVLGVDAGLAVLTAGLAVVLTAIARRQDCPPITVIRDHPADELAVAAAD